MARVAPRVPELTDVLCEKCGYVLNGLPPDGRCPECGTPVADSVGTARSPTAWDATTGPPQVMAAGFVRTTSDVILHPARFYRTLAVGGAMVATMRPPEVSPIFVLIYVGFTLGLAIGTYLALDGITRLAARLTAWEGTYRGYRLPYDVVLRGLYYHAPHYLPVAAVTVVTVVGFQLLLAVHALGLYAAPAYLYVLCGEVVASAFYLFQTYWIGMRNMLYANR